MRPSALPPQFDTIPASLKAIPRWVLWRHTLRKGGYAKVPYTIDGSFASSTNPSTWTTFAEVDMAWALGDFDGIGIVIDGTDFHGIDLDDCRDPATGALSALAQEVLSRVEGYAEVSPSGTGIKLFTPTNLTDSRTKKEAGVELYVDDRYFTVTGHGLNGHNDLAMLPQDLSWFVERVFDETLTTTAVTDPLATLKPPLDGWDLARVVDEILRHLDPDCGYEAWLRVGAILHHQGQSDEAWCDAWDAWSAGSGKYAEGNCLAKWATFSETRNKKRGPATLASLLAETKAAREHAEGASARVQIDAARALIAAAADEIELRGRVASTIKANAALDGATREVLAGAWNLRHRELAGVKLPIADVRALLGTARSFGGNSSMPEWARPWVFVSDMDKFFNTETKEELTVLGFRVAHNRFMPVNREGHHERADVAATEDWGMPVVAHKSYMPACGPVFEMFGRRWVNLYRPESVPEVPAVLSPDDLAAVATVQAHFERYLPDARERGLFIAWLAHNVQHPGKKIRWAPYVHGVQGDGKSFFAELVGCAMGGQNVRSLNGSTLESNFTDWAVGYALVAIEEMKQHGHNRFDTMNKVKPVITNSEIEIHPKGKASYTAPNVSNYLILSNYLDGAPVDAGDRRYMFLSSPVTTEAAIEMTTSGYFKALFNAIYKHPGALRSWLLGADMPVEFEPDGRAPETRARRTVIEMSKTDLQSAAEGLLEDGALGVGLDVISSAHFTRALTSDFYDKPQGVRVKNLLSQLGFSFVCRKKWKGEMCRIWAKGDWRETELIQKLNDTDIEDFLR